MSSDPAVQQDTATPMDPAHVVWSVMRAAVFGLAAAVAGAGLYAAIVILTGYEVGLVAMALGAGVGLAVMVGHPRIADGWVRALSALLTLFSLLLASYLLIWLYDGEGFAPVPVSVGEAATILREFLAEEPSELLFWGLALLTAFGIGTGEEPEVDEERNTPADRSWPVVQVVDVKPHPLRAADVELVVILRGRGGGLRLRRVSLVASDLPAALPHLFDPDPDDLTRVPRSGEPVRVVEHCFDSAEEAMAAAHGEFPVADPDDWVGSAEFSASVEDHPDFAALLKPAAERVGGLGSVMVGLGCLAVAAGAIYAGYRLNVLVGLDTPERRDTLPDHVFTIVLLVLVAALTFLTGRSLARLVARRNLASATARGGPLNARPDEAASDQGRVTDRVDPPGTLVERPRVRLFWCALLLGIAVGGVVAGITARDELGTGWGVALVVVSLAVAVVGVACLRLSIVADASGLTITNLVRRHTIHWPDLDDVRLEKVEADVDLGFHHLVFVTRAGRRIRADAPTGRIRPGNKLPQLQRTLLVMKNRYAPWTTPMDVRPE